ncbi:MAG: DUF507 family protein [Bdellovibrionaceae bacterium]|nr:DUF507 family protein [Pseudobdellovibrionaceae bacterium]
MKLTPLQMQKLAEKVLAAWKANKVVTLKVDEPEVLRAAVAAVQLDYQREAALDVEVNKMLDQLERSNPGEFQRFKMFPMIKQKLAKERKIVL